MPSEVQNLHVACSVSRLHFTLRRRQASQAFGAIVLRSGLRGGNGSKAATAFDVDES